MWQLDPDRDHSLGSDFPVFQMKNCPDRQIIISPLVYLMEERRIMHSDICQPPKMVSGGWILDLLPEVLKEEAKRRVTHPLAEIIAERISLKS